MPKGTSSSSGSPRVTGTAGAPKSHIVAKGAPKLEAGTPKAAAAHPGAFKSKPGRGNTA